MQFQTLPNFSSLFQPFFFIFLDVGFKENKKVKKVRKWEG